MSCQSIACVWSSSPPSHLVTALTILPNPPTLYTGGSDGSIVWWNLSSPSTLHPVALLCGHASEITDLATCIPTQTPVLSRCHALISACSDGVLCVWTRSSGRCSRRGSLPPWAGRPRGMMTAVSGEPRYVCIACGLVELEGGDGDGNRRNGSSKISIFIIDSSCLSIVRIVSHEVSPFGDLTLMSVLPVGKDQSFTLIDDFGRVRLLGMEGELDGGNDGKTFGLENSASLGHGERLNNGESVVSFDVYRDILIVVFKTKCLFKNVHNGSVVGEISLLGTWICKEGHLAGGVFLHDVKCESESEPDEEGFEVILVLWNKEGTAVSYIFRASMNNSGIKLLFKPLAKVQGFSHHKKSNTDRYFRFCKLDGFIVRVESVCSSLGGLSIWRPHITMWSIPELLNLQKQYLDFSQESKESCSRSIDNIHMSVLLGQGGFPISWVEGASSCPVDLVGQMANTNEKNTKHDDMSTSGSVVIPNEGFTHIENEQVVSSSIVISQDSNALYAVVYGYYSGYMQVIRFEDSLSKHNSGDRSFSNHTRQYISKQSFSGHSSAILCLAVHHMLPLSKVHDFHNVLISGSLDCTIRLWDLDNDNRLLFVFHHHISPVKQIILPPHQTDSPWCNCFLSIGEDCCVALMSLETLRLERLFPGHPFYPSMVAWDSKRGYIACLCRNCLPPSNAFTVLHIWDVKTGARERVFHGMFSYSVFDYFCRDMDRNANSSDILSGGISASIPHLPRMEVLGLPDSHSPTLQKEIKTYTAKFQKTTDTLNSSILSIPSSKQTSSIQSNASSSKKTSPKPIKCSCPFPGIVAFNFDLACLVLSCKINKHDTISSNGQVNTKDSDWKINNLGVHQNSSQDNYSAQEPVVDFQMNGMIEGYLIRFSLGLLHLWDVDTKIDKLLMDELNILKPEGLFVAFGIPGDRGSMMLTFPGLSPILELWKFSSEFCAMRSLTIVSLAQYLIAQSHSKSAVSSALAAFYARDFAEKVPDVKPPSLQILVSFWQDPSEHVRMAARSLFHFSAPRAIPVSVFSERTTPPAYTSIPGHLTEEYFYYDKNNAFGDKYLYSNDGDTNTAWLESYGSEDWISWIGGTMQDAIASNVVVAATLAVWHPSIVKTNLAVMVVNHLVRLVMSFNDRYSSTAAELLAEGMDSTWKTCIDSKIPQIIKDIFSQIEHLNDVSSAKLKQNGALSINIQETLVDILLPSLAMANIPGFLNVIESQIWTTSSDSPVHLVSVKILIRVIRGLPKLLAPYLDKIINFILQTMDPANSDMRRMCLQSSMVALREVARAFPMVSLSEVNLRLAVGDVNGDINSSTIRVYDLHSMEKIKVLDASGPLGLPKLLSGSYDAMTTTISAVSFSPDGKGVVAFSAHGLVIRWWSLESAWWEKLSKILIPVQCTKLIYVPPWEGLSPNSSRKSIIASMIVGHDNGSKSPERTIESSDLDNIGASPRNVDLSYRLDWVEGGNVVLSRHKQKLGSFQF